MDRDTFVIFFGPTPHSTDDKPKAASAINFFAKIEGNLLIYKNYEFLSFTVKKGD